MQYDITTVISLTHSLTTDAGVWHLQVRIINIS